MRIGILALQGAVQPHEDKLRALGIETRQVRTPEQLDGLSGIILPGGESSTMLHLLKLNSLWEPLARFIKERPTWGLCAGCILLAKEVSHPAQPSFQAIDISVTRNAYGRQNESFIDRLKSETGEESIEGVFIRAPRITRVGPGVQKLYSYKDETVMARQEQVWVSTFHPELTDSPLLHHKFIETCQDA